jgi:hypothetical protein
MTSGPLYATLTKAAFHRRLSLTLRLLLLTAAAGSLSLAVLFAADNLFNLSAAARATVGLAFLAGVLGGTAFLYVRYWRRPVDAAKMAVYLEQRYGIADNRLVNAVHFDRDPSVPAFIRELFDRQAETSCADVDFRAVWQHANLKPALRLCGVGVLAFLAYAIPFAPHARNAFLRYLNPSSEVTPLNFTQFAVAPGDTEVAEGRDCAIRVHAAKFGRPAGGLDLLVRDGNATLLYPMRSEADGFAFDLRDVSQTTRYAVKNGGDVSRWYTVVVIPRPRLSRLTVTVEPPAYTGEKAEVLSPQKREAAVLAGSTVRVQTVPARGQQLRFLRDGKDVPDAHAELSFALAADTELAIDVRDDRGRLFPAVWLCRFKAVADQHPEVRFLNRELNVEVASGQPLPLTLHENDDFGLSALELYTVQNQKEKILKRFDYRERKRDRDEASVLAVSDGTFARNASYQVWARVFDNHQPPQSGVVPIPVTLHVIDPAQNVVTDNANDPYARLFAVLTEALDQEKNLRDWLAVRIESDRKDRISHAVHKRQESVHERISTGASLAADLVRDKKIRKSLADGVTALKTELSEPLVHRLPVIADLADEPRKAALNDVVLRQSAIITVLQRLLGAIGQNQALDEQRKTQLADEDQEQKLFSKLQKLKEDVGKFKEAQSKILADTEAIDKKAPEDWTEAEEKLLGDLAAKEQNYAKFFQAAFNDLSKVPNQDFSNSTMADEMIEMVEELQKAGAALEKKHVEIATVNEELLGEQATSIETNLERWLADAKDNIKWNGEEAGVTPDVPLQDLPAELTDIIGDLIDNVKDMEDVEDSSNTSLSSFDKGIGWGASDGNMSDMSAKGVTGNSMPNNNEVGGRSGEGRSGKSSGQFVEQEATGKGGRDTPTRLVQSPFEKGTVKDTSKDPQGGATGGGKQSGLGGEGLRGITPTQKPDVEQRLPGQQAELRQKAEALMRELNVRNLPTGDLEDAINKMELIQKYRSTGQGLATKQVASDVISSLKDARTAIKVGVSAGVEKNAATAKRISVVSHPDNESTPSGYESSVDAYFRALAEPQSEN